MVFLCIYYYLTMTTVGVLQREEVILFYNFNILMFSTVNWILRFSELKCPRNSCNIFLLWGKTVKLSSMFTDDRFWACGVWSSLVCSWHFVHNCGRHFHRWWGRRGCAPLYLSTLTDFRLMVWWSMQHYEGSVKIWHSELLFLLFCWSVPCFWPSQGCWTFLVDLNIVFTFSSVKVCQSSHSFLMLLARKACSSCFNPLWISSGSHIFLTLSLSLSLCVSLPLFS